MESRHASLENEMSTMSDATAKVEAQQCLARARKALETALLWPKGLSVEDFHDIKNMVEILKETQNPNGGQ